MQPSESVSLTQRNWSGTLTYGAARFHQPRSLAEVQALVRGASSVRALGTRHSFNDLADTPGDLISMDHLNRVTGLDETRRTVTVEGGVRYAELGPWLHERGFALPNLASFPQLSIAGAAATGTHGSGNRHRGLAASVSALQLVMASGETTWVSREQNSAEFDGLVVSLGAVGLVTALTLDTEPTYLVRQDVYEGLPLSEVTEHFDAVMGGSDSVSLFTRYQAEGFHAAWLKRRVDAANTFTPAPTWFGATLATHPHHPVPGGPAERCTPQLGAAGPWFERWPHFRDGQTPSSGHELQSEYLLPRAHGPAALEALFSLGGRMGDLLIVAEVRTVAADDLWLSPAYRQDSAAFHFTWQPDMAALHALLPEIEAALAPFSARPHWGKVFTMNAARIEQVYPRLPDFRQLCTDLDPQGKFRNAFLNRYIFER